jgi:hypothetical protein
MRSTRSYSRLLSRALYRGGVAWITLNAKKNFLDDFLLLHSINFHVKDRS